MFAWYLNSIGLFRVASCQKLELVKKSSTYNACRARAGGWIFGTHDDKSKGKKI
jgi:hypothetical protein